jgi:hypothetical protein
MLQTPISHRCRPTSISACRAGARGRALALRRGFVCARCVCLVLITVHRRVSVKAQQQLRAAQQAAQSARAAALAGRADKHLPKVIIADRTDKKMAKLHMLPKLVTLCTAL